MFGKDANWWFGSNSIFATAISQTKWGAGGSRTIQSGTSESELLKYGMIFGLFYLLAK